MASPERTLLDALDRPRYAGGIGEVSRIVAKAADSISWQTLLGLAKQWSESAVVQRLGYFLDLHGVALRPHVRKRLVALVAPGSKVQLGPRAEHGTGGRLVQPWGIIENVPRQQLLEPSVRRQKRSFPKRRA